MTSSSYLQPRGLLQDLSGLLGFYQNIFRTWKLVIMTRSIVAAAGEDLIAEFLLHNPHLRVQVVESPLLHRRMVLAGASESGGLGGTHSAQPANGAAHPMCPCHVPPVSCAFLERVLQDAPLTPLNPSALELIIEPLPHEPL